MAELRGLADRQGAYAPDQGDGEPMVTTGKVKIADMTAGDPAILKAMSTNESDSVTADRSGAENSAPPEDDRAPHTARATTRSATRTGWSAPPRRPDRAPHERMPGRRPGRRGALQ